MSKDEEIRETLRDFYKKFKWTHHLGCFAIYKNINPQKKKMKTFFKTL